MEEEINIIIESSSQNLSEEELIEDSKKFQLIDKLTLIINY